MKCRRNCGLAYADSCPPVTCPSPELPPISRVCTIPDCSRTTNRPFIFPHNDPNKYYQCRPKNAMGEWESIVRDCGCETYFSYEEQRCVHPFEWFNQCSGTSNVPPAPIACPRECPTCDGATTATPAQTTTATTTTQYTTQTTTIYTTPSTTWRLETIPPAVDTTPPSTCNCFCWCTCPNSSNCWFPCVCNVNNCSC